MMMRVKQVRARSVVIAVAGALILVVAWETVGKEEKRRLDDGAPCEATLQQAREQNLEKISSYTFPEAEKYLYGLFANPLLDDDKMPEDPVFVTAFSASHYTEGQGLMNNVNNVARKNFPKSKFFIFDLGLYSGQRKELAEVCWCEIRDFPFKDFPSHVGIMKGYAWKPLVIQLAAKEHPFVIWMDASVRFKTSDLDQQFQEVKRLGVKGSEGYAPIAMRTHPNTFQILHEDPCTFRETNEFEATFIMIYATKFVSEYFLKPWVSCALTFGCLVPDNSLKRYSKCNAPDGPVYFDCHRFDQSVLSILLYRLYYEDIKSRRMKHEFYQFCKSADETPFLPQFLNEILISKTETCQ